MVDTGMKAANQTMVATLYRPVKLATNDMQVGVLGWIVGPGNATKTAPVVTIWEGTIIHLVGLEANDNLFGCVWG